MRAAGGTYAISMRYRSARVGHSRPLDTEPVNQGCVFASLAFELDHPLSPRMAAQPPGSVVQRPMHQRAHRHKHHQQKPVQLGPR